MATTNDTISYIKSFFELINNAYDSRCVSSHLSFIEGLVSMASVCSTTISWETAQELRLEAETLANARNEELKSKIKA